MVILCISSVSFIAYFYFRLSERNCVEIISKLGELGLLDVYHTNDGKEYITPAQLSREIQDEVFLHGGWFVSIL